MSIQEIKIRKISFNKRANHYNDCSELLKLVCEFIAEKKTIFFVESNEDLLIF